MTPYRCVLVRHGEAEPVGPTEDHERPLTGRGRAQSRAVGEALRRGGLEPGHVLCSTALRARQTAAELLDALDVGVEPDYTRDLYTATPDDALAAMQLTDPEVATLLVVGHNPTMSQLAGAFLADTVALPPAGAVVTELEVPWLYAAPGTGSAWRLA